VRETNACFASFHEACEEEERIREVPPIRVRVRVRGRVRVRRRGYTRFLNP